ncbi:MAG: sigma-70 family RNA polymerase sigma factor [Oscillospiraceae bacterium]|nr:sigma-70 family RNA polymerase sigma factor [Oscillospiraceae bacterium]
MVCVNKKEVYPQMFSLDSKERNLKVEENLGLVRMCARKFEIKNFDYDDIFQVGCVGLVKAVSRFDCNRGIKFSTYAVHVILGEIKQFFRENGQMKVSRSIKDLALRIKKEYKSFLKSNKREPTVGEISELLGVSREEVAEAIGASKTAISLSQKNKDGSAADMEIPIQSEDEEISNRISVHSAISELKCLDRKLIYLRFFKSKTQMDSAKLLGMTQVQVSRREKVIFNILKSKLN